MHLTEFYRRVALDAVSANDHPGGVVSAARGTATPDAGKALREAARPAADAYLTETEAGAFAIVPAAQLSQEQAEEVDRQYAGLKDSGALRRRDDRHALDDQIQMQGCIGWLPA